MPALYKAITETFQEVQTQASAKHDYKMATTAKTLVDAAETQLAGDDARDDIAIEEQEEVL